MNSNKRSCNCCCNNGGNKRRRSSNIEARVSLIDKENVIQQRRSCGCGCGCGSAHKLSVEVKANVKCCQPRRNSEIISQCLVNKAVDSKVNVATRPPLGELKVKSSNIQCCSTANNCYGAVKKIAFTNTQNFNSNRKSAPLAVSTVKKNPTRSSTGGNAFFGSNQRIFLFKRILLS